jgi:hypothetical protein
MIPKAITTEEREIDKYSFNDQYRLFLNHRHQVQLFLVKQAVSFLMICLASTRSLNVGTPSSWPAKNHPVLTCSRTSDMSDASQPIGEVVRQGG